MTWKVKFDLFEEDKSTKTVCDSKSIEATL